MQQSGRPSRRCGKPKRFDESDSEEETPGRSAPKKTLSSLLKRKIAFSDDSEEDGDKRTPKKQKTPTAKSVHMKPTVMLEKNVVPSTALQPSRIRVGPKSVQEKWKAEAELLEEEAKLSLKKDKDLVDPSNAEEVEGEGDPETLESMLTEYRQMFGKAAVIDMTKGNAMSNGVSTEKSAEDKKECRDCAHYKEELSHFEEMIKLKDCELKEVIQSINLSKTGHAQKHASSLSENIEKRMEYHKLHLESEKKLRSVQATAQKWETLYNAEAGKTKDLELRCEALELKLKIEQKKASLKKSTSVENMEKMKELTELKNYHVKNCSKINEKMAMMRKENAAALKSVQKNEAEYKNKFMRMKKHYQMLLDHYIQKDSKFSKRKDILERKMAMYKDVGSRHQIIRDASKYLNKNQLVFLEGQLSTERTLCGKGNTMPSRYKEFLLSLYQTSVIAYKTLKSYNFNIPPTLSIQQLSQSEAGLANGDQYELLSDKIVPVPVEKRTLRALNSDEEDKEIADLLDTSHKPEEGAALTDEEAEDGVDGEYGDVQPEENNIEQQEEEEEEGGADYLSEDEPTLQRTAASNEEAELDQNFQASLQRQLLDTQLVQGNDCNSNPEAPQFETMETDLDHHGVMSGHTLVEQVEPIDPEVVEQLVDSIEPFRNHQIQQQIEITNNITGVEMVSVEEGGQIIESGDMMVQSIPEKADEANDDNAPAAATAVIASVAETAPTDETVASAETGVAERGPDMPLL